MLFFALFFFNDTATTEIYTLSLHDALPICIYPAVDPLDSTSRILDAQYIGQEHYDVAQRTKQILQRYKELQDRKSTRLNSSHMSISYAVFCLKKKTKTQKTYHPSCLTQSLS